MVVCWTYADPGVSRCIELSTKKQNKLPSLAFLFSSSFLQEHSADVSLRQCFAAVFLECVQRRCHRAGLCGAAYRWVNGLWVSPLASLFDVWCFAYVSRCFPAFSGSVGISKANRRFIHGSPEHPRTLARLISQRLRLWRGWILQETRLAAIVVEVAAALERRTLGVIES